MNRHLTASRHLPYTLRRPFDDLDLAYESSSARSSLEDVRGTECEKRQFRWPGVALAESCQPRTHQSEEGEAVVPEHRFIVQISTTYESHLLNHYNNISIYSYFRIFIGITDTYT